jgi:CHAT domain-containing protein/tetratricopeptide (TPR) repeat protein
VSPVEPSSKTTSARAALPDPVLLRARLVAGDVSDSELEAILAEVRSHALSDLPRALSCAEELVAASSGQLNVQARTLRAHLSSYAGRLDDALAELTLAQAASAEWPATQARVLLAMVQPLARLGKLAEAATTASTAAEIFDREGNAIEAAKARVNAAIVHRMRGSIGEALSILDEAMPAFASDPMSAAVAQSNRAECLLDLDRFPEASAAFELARSQFEAAGNTHVAAIVEGNLADLAGRLGQVDDALPRFERARRVFEASGSMPDVARLLAEEAELLAAYGAFRDARARYTQAIDTLRTAGLKRELVRACLGLGMMLLRQGELSAARTTLNEAAAAMAELRPDELTPQVRLGMALSQALTTGAGPGQETTGELDAILASVESRPVLHAALTIEAAGLLLDAGHPDAAAPLLNRATLASAPLTHRVRAEHLRAKLARLAGQGSIAARVSRDALRSAAAVRDLAMCGSFRLSFAGAWQELASDACVTALEAGETADAFAAAEMFRSRSLLDPVAPVGAAAGDTPGRDDLSRRLEACTAHLRVMYGRLERGSPSAPTAESLAAVESERQLLADRLAQTGAAGSAGQQLTLQEVVARTAADTASICFFADRGSYGAFVITKDRATVHWPLAPRRVVDSCVHKLQVLVEEATVSEAAGPSKGLWERVGSQLYEMLLEPLAERLNEARLVQVSPAAELHGVPFHALFSRSGWSHEGRDFMTVPSVGFARLMPERSAREGGSAVFIGVSDEIAPMMAAEAAALAESVPSSVVLSGSAARRSALVEELPQASLVHIATHCVFSPIAPSSSRLRLHDGWMTARELARLIRPGAVVVLAGCDSGRTSRSPGEDRQGLVQALLVAGCRVVVHSLWRLHDRTATRLLEPLYGCVRQRDPCLSTRSIVSAINDAQRQARACEIHPAWWGSLAVTGGDS